MDLQAIVDEPKFLKRTIVALIIVHSVGVIGIPICINRPGVFSVSWVFLVASILLLAMFHRKFKWNELLPAIAIILLGYGAEVFGVNTGYLFGDYYYGGSLGIKVFSVPLIIGLNWLMLTYVTKIIAQQLISYRAMQVVVGSLLMVGYDFLLEIPAERLNMWHWINGAPDYHNFLGWFLVAAIAHILFINKDIEFKNKLALPLFVIQLCFFGLLSAMFLFI